MMRHLYFSRYKLFNYNCNVHIIKPKFVLHLNKDFLTAWVIIPDKSAPLSRDRETQSVVTRKLLRNRQALGNNYLYHFCLPINTKFNVKKTNF